MRGEELAQEIRKEHEALIALMRRLQAEVIAPRHSWTLLAEDLRVFLKHLRRHFELEEEGGFMEDILWRWPQAASQVDALRAEHTRLLQEAERLIHRSDQVMNGPPARAWAEACHRLLSAIREHERKENRLIQELFYIDVGGGD